MQWGHKVHRLKAAYNVLLVVFQHKKIVEDVFFLSYSDSVNGAGQENYTSFWNQTWATGRYTVDIQCH